MAMMIKKAQAGKKVVKKKASHPNDAYKNMINPETGKKGQMGGEGTNPPFSNEELRQIQKQKNMGSGKKMQAGGVVGKKVKKAGPVDPKGAYTKVQKRTIAGKKTTAKAKAGAKMSKCKYGCN